MSARDGIEGAPMTCEAFQRWLDDGMPAASVAAERHAAACASCARSLAAARELDALLETAVVAAPARLGSNVMARIEAIETLAHAGVTDSGQDPYDPPMAWWVRAAAQPATALALALAALVLWQRDAITTLAGVLVARAGAWLASAMRPGAGIDLLGTLTAPLSNVGAGGTFARPEVMLAVAFAVAPAAAWVSFRLWRWAEERV